MGALLQTMATNVKRKCFAISTWFGGLTTWWTFRCRRSNELHDKRHREIASLIHQIQGINGDEIPQNRKDNGLLKQGHSGEVTLETTSAAALVATEDGDGTAANSDDSDLNSTGVETRDLPARPHSP